MKFRQVIVKQKVNQTLSHHNTVFSQLLKLLPRHEFETLAKQHHTGRSFRTASRWSQFVSMAMAQLAGRNSLRDIVENISAQAHRLYHLGSTKLSRSNLSRINDAKPYTLYEALFGKLLHRCQGVVPGHNFRFNKSSSQAPRQQKNAPFKYAASFTGMRKRGSVMCFLTNNFKLAAKTIADIYKARWQVELFFKWIKQNLKIKSFVGTSKNAVMTQIWIALCIYLLVAFLKFQSRLQKSTQQILRLLQMNMFEKRDLMALLRGDPPYVSQVDVNQLVLL